MRHHANLRLLSFRSASVVELLASISAAAILLSAPGCNRPTSSDPSSLTFLIESNPANLDPSLRHRRTIATH